MCSGIVRQLCYKQCWTIYTNIYEYQDIANLKLSLARKSRSTPSQSSAVVRSAGNLCAGSWSSRRMVGNITAWSRDAARIFGIFKKILQYKMTWRERGKKRERKQNSFKMGMFNPNQTKQSKYILRPQRPGPSLFAVETLACLQFLTIEHDVWRTPTR